MKTEQVHATLKSEEDAIQLARNLSGVVLTDQGKVVWSNGNHTPVSHKYRGKFTVAAASPMSRIAAAFK